MRTSELSPSKNSKFPYWVTHVLLICRNKTLTSTVIQKHFKLLFNWLPEKRLSSISLFLPYYHYRLHVLLPYYHPETRVFVQSVQSKNRTTQHNTFSRATFKQQTAIKMSCPLRKTPSQAKVLPRYFLTDKHIVTSTIVSLFCLNSESTSTTHNILHIL